LNAAIWVFARRGYRRGSITDIIARAGVARGTFYLYFESKEGIFHSLVEDFHIQMKSAFEALDEAAAQMRAQGPRAVLQASCRSWLSFFALHRDATRVVLGEGRAVDARFEQDFIDLRQSVLTRFSARFRNLQTLGLVAATIDPDLAAHFQLGMLDELLNWRVLRDDLADIDRLAQHLADFEWSGLRPDRI
jgi:AcrR family transcriptional regulator